VSRIDVSASWGPDLIISESCPERELAALAGDLHRAGDRYVRDHVGALVEQCPWPLQLLPDRTTNFTQMS